MSVNSSNADNDSAVETTCPSLHDVVQPVCDFGIYSLKYPLTIGAVSRKEAVYWACVCVANAGSPKVTTGIRFVRNTGQFYLSHATVCA